MNRLLAAFALATAILVAGAATAAERTVTLAVPKMYCASCPYIVKKALAKVDGVARVTTSFETKTATVTYDDQKTTVEALTDTLTQAGYDGSHPVEAAAAK